MRLNDVDTRDRHLAELMTEMERQFNIPMLRNEAWEKENNHHCALSQNITFKRDAMSEITVKLDDVLLRKLREAADIKGISVEGVAEKVLEQYADKYINMMRRAEQAADRSLKK